jgi:hypothetical protein
MRPFGQQKTHASNGEELSEFFISEDGTFSAFVDNNESEIVGFYQTIFGGGWIAKDK